MTNVHYTFDYVKWTVHGGIYYSCEKIEHIFVLCAMSKANYDDTFWQKEISRSNRVWALPGS